MRRAGSGARSAAARAVGLALAAATLLPATAAGDEPGPLVPEPWDTGWAFYVDNDALLIGRDQQYTGGFALTLSGRRAAEYRWSLDPVLGRLNAWSGMGALGAEAPHLQHHGMHIGVAGFTPEDIGETAPIGDDRPYASLLFLSNTRQRVLPRRRVAYQSSLIVGLLGTNVVRQIQNSIHTSFGDRTEARGWDHQISDGGEPTATYVAARYETIAWHQRPGAGDYQVQTSLGATAGFATQAGAGISARWGRFSTPWWAFVPDYAEYISLGTPISGHVAAGIGDELFVWGGLNLRYSFYNALLEGQFRDSEVTYDRDELRSELAEASLGLTVGIGEGTYVTLAVRARTPELRDADAALPVWGSLVFSRTY